jgi:hypothetical protein
MWNRLLHAITAAFHEVKDHRRVKRLDREKVVVQQEQTANGTRTSDARVVEH